MYKVMSFYYKHSIDGLENWLNEQYSKGFELISVIEKYWFIFKTG